MNLTMLVFIARSVINLCALVGSGLFLCIGTVMTATMRKITNYFSSPKPKKQKFDEETKTVE
jgi:hypothetical protein